ncbi:delta-sarcoglycan-like [Lineus longissimus]|uniref:delta-sarcoglycan-like n=1 Tax=Lineus longissimus TaxID=88925 RepID=UPI00315CA6C8
MSFKPFSLQRVKSDSKDALALSDGSSSLAPRTMVCNDHYASGIYGWRKRCLYCSTVFLLSAMIINFALTVWILRVMDFSIDGMGKLRITKKGVRLEGDVEFIKNMKVSKIGSYKNKPLKIQSDTNISMQTTVNDVVRSKLILANNRIEAYSDAFEVKNAKGRQLFYADSKKAVLGAEILKITGAKGAAFNGSVQTPRVRSDAYHNLRLESPTEYVQVSAPRGVNLFSPAGEISITSLYDMKIQSLDNAIRLDSDNVQFLNLPVSEPIGDGTRYPGVYQLCICGHNGRLFLAPPDSSCAAVENTCT